MRIRYLVVALVCAFSLALAVAWTHAQAPSWTAVTEPVIKTGDDLGLRVEWMNGGTPYGHLVVRQNGQWIDARIGAPGDRQVIPAPPSPPPPPSRPR